jgi:hypothetical protein
MPHLDEGTLHALLDGELDLAEVSEIQKHLGSCVACGSRLQEVKQVLAEADRLVGAMEMPAGATRPRAEPSRTPPPPPPPPRLGREPGNWDEPTVLLVPDPIDANAWRKRWWRGVRWAAAIAVVVVGGKMVGNAMRPTHPMLSERDLTSASPSVPPAVVSPEETRRPESTLATRQKLARSQTRPPAPKMAPRPAPVADERVADTMNQLADSQMALTEDSVAADSAALATEARADSLSEPAIASSGAVTESTQRAKDDTSDQPTAADELATRRAAAAALADLDRERMRERANAATAALPPAARPEAAAMEPAPRPPTLEQRAQVYLRIGLDEAVKQLGGPVHVIEGMTPQFIGLTRSQLIPGTGAARPVVRVVYLDARGRMILLDQQRVSSAPSSPTQSASLRWTIGDVMLYLRGEPSPDVLRSLQARVR